MKPNHTTFSIATTYPEKPPLVMALLRSETATAHKNLEGAKLLARLFTPDYSMREYRELLAGFFGFLSAVEPVIFKCLAESQKAFLGHKAKAHLLALDLRRLGMDDSEIALIPLCDAPPKLASFASQMGALYVLEGSTLGGRVIAKWLKEHFGTEIMDKLSYYNCYGENVGTEWKAFQNFMGSQFNDDSEDIDAVLAAANETFLALHQWLEKT